MIETQAKEIQSSETRKDNPQAAETRPLNLYAATVRSDARCVVERTAEVMGGKWTTLILRELLRGTRRFGELRAALAGISPKTLTDIARPRGERRHHAHRLPGGAAPRRVRAHRKR